MFLVLHGWGGSDEPHWQWWLAEQLKAAGQQVAFPALPHRDAPRLDEWLQALQREMAAASATGEPVTVICHSLAVPLWLHYLEKQPHIRVQRVLLVAPPGPAAFEQFETTIGSFAPVPVDAAAVAGAAQATRLVYSAGDPYCAEDAYRIYGAPLGIPADRLPDAAGHVNVEAGYGPWPAVLDWCLGRRAGLAGNE